jgi:ABC-type sugar transport system ATPase subunit
MSPCPPPETPRPFLEMRGISKRFGSVQALDGVDFDLRAGEVHAIVGENGAGKSTLIKVIAGAHAPDGGLILISGRPTAIPSPRAARLLGIAVVHQELTLFPALTVAENVLAGRQPAWSPLKLVDRARARRAAREVLDLFGTEIDPDRPTSRLGVAAAQVVEIARALSQEACVLILDEPTSALSDREAEALFRTIRRLREKGFGIIHISHRLEEVLEIADRITVLRDGRRVDTIPRGEATVDGLIRRMVGRDLADLYGSRASVPGGGDEVLRLEDLSSPGRFRDISLRLAKGEILGLAGLVGAGRSEVGKAVFGSPPAASGRIFVEGRETRIRSPRDALRLGIALLSEDRRREGLFPEMSVRENLTVTHLRRFSRLGLLSVRGEAAGARAAAERLRVRAAGVEARMRDLSGGNQQKVLLARWLEIGPRVLIADEPTRGVDVGAKAEIYAILRRLASEGLGIILISSEMPEVIGMSDRILVLHEGRIAGELSREGATEERILALASGRGLEAGARS